MAPMARLMPWTIPSSIAFQCTPWTTATKPATAAAAIRGMWGWSPSNHSCGHVLL
jgi:hypothetical protein